MNRTLSPALAAGLLLMTCACSFPPYDESLSLAALSARKMNLAYEVGPLGVWAEELRDRTLHLLPFRTDLEYRNPHLGGYLAAQGSDRLQLYPLHYDPIDSRYFLGSRMDEGLFNPDPRTFHLALDVAKGNNHLNVYKFDHSIREVRIFDNTAKFLNLIVLSSRLGEVLVSGTVSWVAGAAVVPQKHFLNDQVFFLWQDSVTGGYGEAAFLTGPGDGLVFESEHRLPFRGLPSLPDERCFYGHDPGSGNGYLSIHDPERGKYRTWRWSGVSPDLSVQELPMDQRVDAVLSNGRLYCQEGGLGTVYDSSGRQTNRFPLGDMRLAYEVYLDGETPTLIFTLPIWQRNDKKDDFLLFRVYSLPTAEIDDL